MSDIDSPQTQYVPADSPEPQPGIRLSTAGKASAAKPVHPALWLLGLVLLGYGACSYRSGPPRPLAAGDNLTWIQLSEGPGFSLEDGLVVKEVRGEWFRVRPATGDSDRWMRFEQVRSVAVER